MLHLKFVSLKLVLQLNLIQLPVVVIVVEADLLDNLIVVLLQLRDLFYVDFF